MDEVGTTKTLLVDEWNALLARIATLEGRAAPHEESSKPDASSEKVIEELRAKVRHLEAQLRELTLSKTMLELADKHDASLLELLENIIVLVPHFFQYPEVTCARVKTELTTFTTDPFLESEWKLVAPIEVGGVASGSVEVFCMEQRPQADLGPFTFEEKRLVRGVAERIGSLFERAIADEAREDSEAKYERLRAAQKMPTHGLEDEILAKVAPLPPPRRDRTKSKADSEQSFLTKSKIAREPLDLNLTVLALAELFIEDCADEVSIETYLEEDLDGILCDPVQIGQLVMNILHNAIEAVGDAGTITVETENVILEAKDLPIDSKLERGRYVSFSVSDDGPGMDEEQRRGAFAAYITTKSKQGHKGLGLTQVREAAESHGGYVSLESKLGEGTKARVLLPAGGTE